MLLFFFLPIGHEQHKVRRIPVITIAIILLCLIIAIATISRAKALTRELDGVNAEIQDLKFEVYTKYASVKKGSWVYDFLFETDARNYGEFYKKLEEKIEKYWKDFTEGKLCEPDDPLYQRYLVLKERKERIERRHPYLRFGFTPAKFRLSTLITHAFLHGGWLHLIFNMFFFFIVAPTLEDTWGRPVLLGLYLSSAVVAALVHAAMYPHSAEPCIGASGAVAGLMGAFAYRFARTRMLVWYFILLIVYPYTGTVYVPAYFVFGLWFALQLAWGVAVKSAPGVSNIAYWAHIGGFAFGLAVAVLLEKTGVEQRYIEPSVEWKVSPEIELDARLTKAMELSASGDFEGAIRLLDEYLADNPESDVARIERLRCYIDLGRLPGDAVEILSSAVGKPDFDKDALDLYMRACEIDDRFCLKADAMFRLYRTFERMGNYGAARRAFKAMSARFTHDARMPATYLSMARLSKKAGDISYARDLLREMIARYPYDPLVDLAKADLKKMGDA